VVGSYPNLQPKRTSNNPTDNVGGLFIPQPPAATNQAPIPPTTSVVCSYPYSVAQICYTARARAQVIHRNLINCSLCRLPELFATTPSENYRTFSFPSQTEFFPQLNGARHERRRVA
jgi:hypothetical protein